MLSFPLLGFGRSGGKGALKPTINTPSLAAWAVVPHTLHEKGSALGLSAAAHIMVSLSLEGCSDPISSTPNGDGGGKGGT